MVAAVEGGRVTPIGREPELAGAFGFLEPTHLAGGRWRCTADPGSARRRSGRPVSPLRRAIEVSGCFRARASGADARLAFAAVIDLLDDVGADELEPLAVPQRRALEAAVLRADPVGPLAELRAIALGLLNVLRRGPRRRRW